MLECSWPISNDKSLSFGIYNFETDWNHVSGLYIFSYQTSNNRWFSLYVGQTDDFATRLPNHERKNEAIRRGATHVHALVLPLQGDRDFYEEKLIQYLQPPMNGQLKKAC